MLTIFAAPKTFSGKFGVIQRNAIFSWTFLRPRPEIILFGNEEGTAAICAELQLVHAPELKCAQGGAPLMGSLFEQAQRLARHKLLCYVNADIILLADFMEALRRVAGWRQNFLMVGRRWDVALDKMWNFKNEAWSERLREYVLRCGKQAGLPGNSDYFAFPQGLWRPMPPIQLGRAPCDSWLIYEARCLQADVIDASSTVMAIHQAHDQSAHRHGLRTWKSEVNANYQVAGVDASQFTLFDATHILGPADLRRPFGIHYLARHVDTLTLFHPRTARPLLLPRLAVRFGRTLMQRVRQVREPLCRLVLLIQSKLPPEGITSILGLAEGDLAEGGLGLRLASCLTWGGSPVVVYDSKPSVIEQAQRMLGGPIQFARSPMECIQQGDLIVIAARSDDFRTAVQGAKHAVIDCCGLLEAHEPQTTYFRWRER